MRSRRTNDYVAAGVVAALALSVSPPAIEFATGRTDLTLRVEAVSLLLVAFLLTASCAVLARARIRRFLFALMACMLPFLALAALEAGAIALRLADRVAPLEDLSILADRGDWPGYLMSEARWQPGLPLYRPWDGPGIHINALGLRTSEPTPKTTGEWRVAVTGGSAVWGWRVRDADTIPVQLQGLQQVGNANLKFFNFGIEGASVAQELALLKRFRETYGIDQVIFYTGANDAYEAYLDTAGAKAQLHLVKAIDGITGFELIKAATRFAQMMSDPSSAEPSHLESESPRLNQLSAGLLAANDYCTLTRLRCDFLLQPLLFTRANGVGSERKLLRTYQRLYPGFAAIALQMYRDAMAAMARGRIHDLSDMFDGIAEPVFLDSVHVNERGNRIAAGVIGASVTFGPSETGAAAVPMPITGAGRSLAGAPQR